MNPSESSAVAAGADAGQGTAENRSAVLRKWQRVLRALLDGRSLNRFEAARELRDWCLNTTVSQLEQRGLKIDRREQTVPGTFGPVHCCQYWLAEESRERARELLGIAP